MSPGDSGTLENLNILKRDIEPFPVVLPVFLPYLQ